MPLHLLLLLVVGGIAGIALLLHLTGRSHRAILTPQGARAAWLRHSPDSPPIDLVVAEDGHAALLRTEDGAGLVWSFGADTVARALNRVEYSETADGLSLTFDDFAAPRANIRLGADERAHWIAMMESR